jgi:hypothetical protein
MLQDCLLTPRYTLDNLNKEFPNSARRYFPAMMEVSAKVSSIYQHCLIKALLLSV